VKIASFRKLRTWTLRQRNRCAKKIEAERDDVLNLYRCRLVGHLEAFDRVLDRMDAVLRAHHDKWIDRRKRRA
jgi:hypothetical protein